MCFVFNCGYLLPFCQICSAKKIKISQSKCGFIIKNAQDYYWHTQYDCDDISFLHSLGLLIFLNYY